MADYPAIAHPWVDSSEAPIYRITFPHDTQDADLRAYFEIIAAWSARVVHGVIWVMDLSRVITVTARQRADYAGFMARMRSFDVSYTRATALVTPNAVVRGIATAVFWLSQPSYPYATFSTVGEGLTWARTKRSELFNRPNSGHI